MPHPTPLLAAALLLVPTAVPARDIETPAYSVDARSGDFEVRTYEPHLVASTSVQGDMEESSDRAFRRLAGYIFGGNTSDDGPPEKIAMTSPVNMVRTGETWTMTFMMPSGYTAGNLPVPDDDRVEIQRWAGGRHAAVRFSGTWSPERFVAKRAELEHWLADQGWTAVGEPILARYDPPWTPWFLRRNEVIIPIRDLTRPDETDTRH